MADNFCMDKYREEVQLSLEVNMHISAQVPATMWSESLQAFVSTRAPWFTVSFVQKQGGGYVRGIDVHRLYNALGW